MHKVNVSDGLIGRFYFKKTGNYNLLGEFSNNKSNLIFTESADTTGHDSSKDFIGTYNATWQENGEAFFATLTITFKTNTTQQIFELKWMNNNEIIFIGEGFVFDDVLIGDYRNFEC